MTTMSSSSPDASIVATIISQLTVGVCLYVFFEKHRAHREMNEKRIHTRKPLPEPLTDSLFSWFNASARVACNHDNLYTIVGLDAYLFLRYLRLCWLGGACCAFIAMITLLPLYYHLQTEFSVSGLTMSTIPPGDPFLWVPCGTCWLFSLMYLYVIGLEVEEVVRWKRRYLYEGDPDIPHQTHYSAIVENIPKEYQNTVKLRILFETLFPGDVQFTSIGICLTPALKTYEERKASMWELEIAGHLTAVAKNRGNPEPHITVYESNQDALQNQRLIDPGVRDQTTSRSKGFSKKKKRKIKSLAHFEEQVARQTVEINNMRAQAVAASAGAPYEAKEVTVVVRSYNDFATNASLPSQQRKYHQVPLFVERASDNNTAINSSRLLPGDSSCDYPQSLVQSPGEAPSLTGQGCPVTDKLVTSPQRPVFAGNLKKKMASYRRVHSYPVPEISVTVPIERRHSRPEGLTEKCSIDGFQTCTPLIHSIQSSRPSFSKSLSRKISVTKIKTRRVAATSTSTPVSSSDSVQSTEHILVKNECDDAKNDPSQPEVSDVNSPTQTNKTLIGGSNNTVTASDSSDALHCSSNDRVITVSEEVCITDKSLTSTGFVTFRSRKAQLEAISLSPLSHIYRDLTCTHCPCPKDIIWSNIASTPYQIQLTAMLVKTCYCVGILLFSMILSGVAVLADLNTLQKYAPQLSNLPAPLYAYLNGQLAVMVHGGVMSVLPHIFRTVSVKIERRKTKTAVVAQVITWFFLYQLANVYVVIAAGTVLKVASSIARSPVEALLSVADVLPSGSVFFINVMLTWVLAGAPVSLLGLSPLELWGIYYKKIQRFAINGLQGLKKHNAMIGFPVTAVDMDYDFRIPCLLFVQCVCFTYWIIAPVVMIVGTMWFGAQYGTLRYLLCYVIAPTQSESGGKMWVQLVNYSLVSLFMATLLTLIYMALKEGLYQTIIMLPLPVVIYSIRCNIFGSDRCHDFIPRNIALQMDATTGEILTKFRHDYFSPENLQPL